ncbi:aldo/keto reductase [Propionicicella superfundia]|uniref:aldo/keto reductase n=1 Tax=Propionicicella superfundia TaxID=348582 RepID=UPI00041A9610|nr:aldo/keto reductase [Propionicicella superfundia]
MNVPHLTLNDGHEIPQFGFGVFKVSNDDIVASVRTALEAGYRHIDTAAVYGNEAGVGQAIRESGIPREDLFVTTKLWNDSQTPGKARAAIEESLTRLGLDHVDLYLIHWPQPMFGEYVGAWESLIAFRDEGLTTSIGVSNFNADHLDAVIAATDVVPAVNQIELHPTFAQPDLVAYDESLGIRTEAWGPLGQGRGELDEPGIVAVAAEVGRTPAQVTLRWHIQRGIIVFPKSVTPHRIEENFAIFDFELTDAQMAAMDALDAGRRGGADPLAFTAR